MTRTTSQTNVQNYDFDTLAPVARPSLFWRLRHLAESKSLEFTPFVFWLTETLRPQITVTLGVADPVPHFAVCQGYDKLSLDGMCFGHEPLNDAGPAPDLSKIETQNAMEYGDFAILTSGPNEAVTDVLGNAEIDLLIINVALTDSLRTTLEQIWISKMSDRGAILFVGGGTGITDFSRQLTQGEGYFVLDATKSVVMALCGNKAPEQLNRLCQMKVGQRGYSTVRTVFMRMGEIARSTLNLQNAIGSQTTEHTQTSVATQTEQLEKLQNKLDARFEDITLLGAKLAQMETEKKEHAQEAQKKLAELEERCTKLVKERDSLKKECERITEKAKTNLLGAQHRLKTLQDKSDAKLSAVTKERDKYKAQEKAVTRRLEEASATNDTELAIMGEEIGALRAQNSSLQSQNEAISTQRQSEIAELGNLLQQKEQASNELARTLNVTQAHQNLINKLKRAHDNLNKALSNRLAVRSYKAARTKLLSDNELVAASNLFDAEWYKATYPDIADQDPLRHFVQNGLYELRNPSPHFDSLKYHLANPDVTENGAPALLHYIQFGKAEGRAAHPVE
ncbi:hypothetical protein [Sulfitobacter donghicola]|uniref:hypothetical protein n=1 Tax=Sulfitobacter donghicola TaxID=421000 RepID=UPI0012DDC04F|nr:hypothetical protein [Sulfitobacter donghicola]